LPARLCEPPSHAGMLRSYRKADPIPHSSFHIHTKLSQSCLAWYERAAVESHVVECRPCPPLSPPSIGSLSVHCYIFCLDELFSLVITVPHPSFELLRCAGHDVEALAGKPILHFGRIKG